MNNNTVSNPKTEEPKTQNMTDENYLSNILMTLKNITNNYSIALNEASNETLYQSLFPLFKEAQDMQREAFELAFRLGWYTLEKAEQQKIAQKYTEHQEKVQELS